MKQVLQNLTDGTTILEDVPTPRCKSGGLLIQSSCSLISVGTERSLVSFGRASYLDKARQQPDKVKMVLNKIKTDGLLPTIETVRSKLDQPMPMGYSNVGTVIEVGSEVDGFKVGDRVVSNGQHAEIVCVSQNLCAKIPDNVSDEEAAFTILGAIALQSVRLSEPTLGESVVIVGLGLVGLMTALLAKLHGCRVIGFDFDPDKIELAQSLGIEAMAFSDASDAEKEADAFSRGRGADIAIVAAASPNSDPMIMAAKMCRKKGRLVQVGVTEIAIPRDILFKKELTVRVSCSYGPGRYDALYEEKGIDYPFDYVRWTEQRNFEAVLDMLAENRISFEPLLSRKFSINEAPEAYDFLVNDKRLLGLLLTYKAKNEVQLEKTLKFTPAVTEYSSNKPIIGAIGAGNYAGRILLPAFKKTGARLKTIATSQGVSGSHYGKKLSFELNTTESDTLFADENINTIVIGTQHNTHSRFVVQALEAGKNVFVEKPLALTHDELDEIGSAYSDAHKRGDNPRLMVGFNRRFSPLIQKLKRQISKSLEPMSIIYTCNAGNIPPDIWLQDSAIGGGRIIGEACHFIDIARYLADSAIVDIQAVAMKMPEGVTDCHDTASLTIRFENGSIATVHYFANGHQSFQKERIEVFQSGKTMVLDNFRRLTGYGIKSLNSKTFKQNKGQQECCDAFIRSIETGEDSPVPYDELMEVSRACINAWDQLLTQ